MELKYIFLICIAAYLIGSINFATVIARIKNKDIKKLGSGNPGTMNVLRSVGKGWGVLVFVLDALKGLGFALIGKFATANPYVFAVVMGFCVVLGHIFPIFDKFRGGKGVATTMGVYIAISPIAGIITLVVLIIFLFVIKYGFIGSFLAVSTFAGHAIYLCRNTWWAIVIIAIWWALVIIAHRGNIKRLIKGEENTLSLSGENKVKVLDVKEEKDDIIEEDILKRK